MQLPPHIAALRPRQWTKNFIVFAAPLFGFSISWPSVFSALLALCLFCAASSSFYLLNDVADIEADRQHPVKCKRPIAAGRVSIPVALVMSVALLVSAITLGWLKTPLLGVTLCSYALLQIAYNVRLKRIAILDILAIATGFVLRAAAGAAATGIYMSPWFLLCTAMLAIFLGIEKRKAELRLLQVRGGKTRSVLKFYSLSLLTRMETVVTTSTLMSYALWSSGPALQGASTPWMLLTLPFVLYGIFRYQLLSDPKRIEKQVYEDAGLGEKSERPEEVLLTDRPILLTVVGWSLSVFLILWLQKQGIVN
ncbi:MAG: decaprenyl-phosphate phosphoribosyltransferase [Cyanobacteria bacterium J06636_16]